jgi:hypothetical protein
MSRLAALHYERFVRAYANQDDLRAETIERFGVSKSAFDVAWTWAIEETGNRHWYEPLPRSRRKTGRTLLV